MSAAKLKKFLKVLALQEKYLAKLAKIVNG